jgi:hypothetical protein
LFALFYASLLALWPALPTQDGSAWVMEGSALARLLAGHELAGCSLVDAVPPNAFAQLAIACLQLVFSAQHAGRLYIALCVIGLCGSLLYLARATGARASAVLAVLPLCAGYPLYHGFLNYMAALPVLCFGLGALIKNPLARGPRGIALLLLLPCVLYSCHGTALGVWGVLLLVQCWVHRSWKLLARAAVSFVPVLVLLALYVSQRSGEGAVITYSAGSLIATVSYRLRSPVRFFSVFHGLAPTYDDPLLRVVAPLLVLLNVGYALWLCVSGLRWAVRARTSVDAQERFLAWSTLALCACFLVMPHDVAKMLNPAERLLLPAAMIGAVGYRRLVSQGAFAWRSGALYFILAAQAVYVLVFGTRAAGAASELIAVRARTGIDVAVVQARQLSFAPKAPGLGAIDLLPRHQVLAMQGLLEQFQAGHLVAPFDTGLFRCVPNDHNHPSGWDLAELRRHERPLIVLGEREHTRVLVDQFGPTFSTLEVGTGFILVQRTAAATH